jgi:hypothetical protein
MAEFIMTYDRYNELVGARTADATRLAKLLSKFPPTYAGTKSVLMQPGTTLMTAMHIISTWYSMEIEGKAPGKSGPGKPEA